jgi:hypothetical protein
MVRDWFTAPAVPDDMLREVFGLRRIDSRAEFVVLYFEYWLRHSTSLFLIRRQVLEAMRGRIDAGNVYDFIALLAKRKVAASFFELTRPVVDSDGALRDFLLSQGVLIDTIRLYAPFSGLNPKDFLDGFAIGVAESFAAVVVDLVHLLELIARAHAEFLQSLVEAARTRDPSIPMAKLFAQVTAVGHAFVALLRELDPTRIPERVMATWKEWNAEFERHLENLDPRAAGRVLGRIGGDLWQLLTGIIEIAALVKVGARAAMQYAPLLVGSLRKAAARAGTILKELVLLVRALGVAAIAALPQVGMGMLKTLVPPRVWEALVHEGRAVVSFLDNTLTLVPAPAFAMASGGAPLGRPFAVVVAHEGRPVMMATVTQPPLVPGAVTAAVRDELDEALDALWGQHYKPFDPAVVPSPAEVLAAQAANLARRLDDIIRGLLQQTTWKTFRKLLKEGRFKPWILGSEVETLVNQRVMALLKTHAPSYIPFPKMQLRTLVDSVFAKAPKAVRDRLRTLLDEPMHRFLRRHPDVLDVIGADARKMAAASDEKFIAYLRERFRWQPKDTPIPAVGRLESDMVLVNPETSQVVNLDWTSSTNADKFENLWRQVSDDLGDGFDGNWAGVPEAYRGKSKLMPEVVNRQLDEVSWHAIRETVVRRRILEEIFGPNFLVDSIEMTYDGTAKLFKRLGKKP